MTANGIMNGDMYGEEQIVPPGLVNHTHATEEDIEDVLDLGRMMHAESVYSWLPFDEEKGRALLLSGVKSPSMFLGISRVRGSVVGFFLGYLTTYFFCNEPMAHDILLYVRPEWRGTNIGKILVDAFVTWGFKRGAKEIAIGVSAMKDNSKTYKFLEKLGFSEVGREFKVRRM